MNFNPLQAAVAAVALSVAAGAASAQVLVTDTFSRTLTGNWGSVDNGSVGGATGSVTGSWIPDPINSDPNLAVGVDGETGFFNNSRVILDYNLAADPAIVAGLGFKVNFSVNPGDGDVLGTGREFAGIALSDTNDSTVLAAAGAITNANNTAIRYAVLPRNSGSAGTLTRTAGDVRTLTATGNPEVAGFNEFIFDQATFDNYAGQSPLPDPFASDLFYDVEIEAIGDFSAGSTVVVTTTVNGESLGSIDIEWGNDGEAYLAALAFNGPHEYDNLSISAVPVPEPASLGLLAVGGLTLLRRRRA